MTEVSDGLKLPDYPQDSPKGEEKLLDSRDLDVNGGVVMCSPSAWAAASPIWLKVNTRLRERDHGAATSIRAWDRGNTIPESFGCPANIQIRFNNPEHIRMPRVANPPAGQSRTASRQMIASPQKQPPTKLTMNDDRGEKAARLHSRQALQEMNLNQIKAAASPMRKLAGHDRAGSESPRTPRSAAAEARRKAAGPRDNVGENSPGRLNVVSGSAATPMKRVPILANFEDWMKMATDNKINAANSWNFALIDYFHDMSLLKEGDGVNFQKASCTLDGCVKIYTSRVDSVATETGKLLSGLADSGKEKKTKTGEDGDAEEGDEDDEEEEGEDGVKKKTKKKAVRSHEATLAPSFASLQLKKLELEFAVDPLFKKASADFDEGGAKGLLLNHLSIDSEGRIVFDSSDDAGETTSAEATRLRESEDSDKSQLAAEVSPSTAEPPAEIDLSALAAKFFPDLSKLDTQDICPSMKSFKLGDPSSDLNIPFLKAADDWREAKNASPARPTIPDPHSLSIDQTGIMLNDDNAAAFDDDDDGGILGGFDMPENVGFGEGGEAWAKDAALEPMMRITDADDRQQDGVSVGDFDPSNPRDDAYTVSLNHMADKNEQENILSYFDNALRSQKAGWAGPEHWRIRKLKAAAANANSDSAPARTRKEKEPFEIDFLAPMDQTVYEMLYTPASSNAAISLPKKDWKTKGRNLLPDDKHFSSRSLLSLFLKPKARIGRRRNVVGMPPRDSGRAESEQEEERYTEMDEAYWARKKQEEDSQGQSRDAERRGDYDADFFADDDAGLPVFDGPLPIDDYDDNEENGPAGFMDAREMLSPAPEAAPTDSQADSEGGPLLPPSSQSELLPGSFGSQLVTQGARRARPEYMSFARVAKKVDVRRLKENMWKGMSGSLMKAMDVSSKGEMNVGGDAAPPTPAPTDDGSGDVDMMDVDMMDVDQVELERDREPMPPQEKAQEVLKFTDMIGDLRSVYPEQQMKDISTSYCFICLLHLANEKGLVLEGDRNVMQEILIRRDESVGEGYVGE